MATKYPNLFDSVPYVPADGNYGPQSPARKPSIWDNLEQASYGMGDGVVNQLSSLQQMVQHPINTATGLFGAARNTLMDPVGTGTAVAGWAQNQLGTATDSPYGFGKVLGENIGLRPMPKNVLTHEMTAYHGSPHNFDQFSMDKIGTGEGAQAYGHGLYFAENPKVAKEYSTVPGPELKAINDQLSALAKQMSADEIGYRKYRNPETYKLAEQYDALMSARSKLKGNFYHVDIPDEHIDKMLDWDKPLSQQGKDVQLLAKDLGLLDESSESGIYKKALASGFSPQDAKAYAKAQAYEPTGQHLYRALQTQSRDAAIARGETASTTMGASQAAASASLNDMGIPGIKYADAGSRGAEKGTRNFVLFDDKLAKVIKKE